jgi:hypothetical protein
MPARFAHGSAENEIITCYAPYKQLPCPAVNTLMHAITPEAPAR